MQSFHMSDYSIARGDKSQSHYNESITRLALVLKSFLCFFFILEELTFNVFSSILAEMAYKG